MILTRRLNESSKPREHFIGLNQKESSDYYDGDSREKICVTDSLHSGLIKIYLTILKLDL